MKPQHTAGPLEYKYSLNDQEYPEYVIKKGTEVLATVHDLGRDRILEFDANARLFAAAPQLLAHLKAACDSLEIIAATYKVQGNTGTAEDLQVKVAHARLIIEKVESE